MVARVSSSGVPSGGSSQPPPPGVPPRFVSVVEHSARLTMPLAFSYGTNGSSAARLTASAYRAERFARTSGGHDDDDDDGDDDVVVVAVGSEDRRVSPRGAAPRAVVRDQSTVPRARWARPRRRRETRVDVILLREQTSDWP